MVWNVNTRFKKIKVDDVILVKYILRDEYTNNKAIIEVLSVYVELA